VRRTSNATGSRRSVAPAYCLASSKTRRKRGRPAGDGAGGGGGDDGGGGAGDGWDGEGASWGDGRADGIWLWQALCLCSLLQARLTPLWAACMCPALHGCRGLFECEEVL